MSWSVEKKIWCVSKHAADNIFLRLGKRHKLNMSRASYTWWWSHGPSRHGHSGALKASSWLKKNTHLIWIVLWLWNRWIECHGAMLAYECIWHIIQAYLNFTPSESCKAVRSNCGLQAATERRRWQVTIKKKWKISDDISHLVTQHNNLSYQSVKVIPDSFLSLS